MNRTIIYLSILLFMIIVSCNKTIESKQTSLGAYDVQMSTIPTAVSINQPFDLLVKITPLQKDSSSSYTVEVDAAMPAHNHGMNITPEVIKLDESGSYKVKNLLFHMKGKWTLKIFIKKSDLTEIATFDFDL